MESTSSLRSVTDLQPGSHLCCLYDTEEERRAVLTAFLRQGLEDNEKVLYISDLHTVEAILGYLHDAGVEVDSCMSRGQLSILTADDAYLRGGSFDPNGMVALLRTETERALAEGYSALRVTGEMTWALRGLPGSEKLIEYEAGLNRFFPGSRCLAICQYARDRFLPATLLHVLRTHPVAVVGTEVYENFYYLAPDDLLGPDSAAATLRSWLETLKARKLAEQMLRETYDQIDRRVDERTKDLLEANEALRLEITLRKRAEEETKRRRRQAEELARLARVLTASLELPEVLDRLARAVTELFPDSASRIWVAEGDRLALRSEAGTPGPPGAGKTTELAVGQGLAGHAALARKPLVVEDVQADPRTVNVEWARQAGYVSYVGVPLLVRDRLVGVLALLLRQRRSFSAEEIKLLTSFGAQAAIALENARLLDEFRAHQGRLEALLEVSRQLSRIQPLEALLRSIAEACGRLLAADSVGFRLVEGNELVVSAMWGDAQQIMMTPRLKIGESLSGLVAATGEPLLVRDPGHDSRLIPPHREAVARLGYRAALIVPLKIGERVAGVLNIHTRRPEGFSRQDLAIAAGFASQAAVALENSRLYQGLQRAFGELTRAQEELVQGEKLRALGQMAGGVAHDFNNTLAIILGRAQLLLGQTKDPELQRQLKVIEKAARDGAQTVRRIQEFTRRKPLKPIEPVDLNQVVEEVIEVTRPRWRDEAQARGIRYEVRIDLAPVPPVAAIASELSEAITNLVLNALEAMPAGGRLTFQTGVKDGRVFCLVADTGIGMPEELKRRVFEPFFTTKVEKGSGLGLSVAYGIIARHGGEIEVQSEVGRGSKFTLWMPVGRGLPEAPKPAPAPRPLHALRVLVIDDEPEIRAVLVDLLTGLGHSVAACADGLSGLARFDEERFDLVITDLGMPGLSGWELVRGIKGKSPAIPVILITGWAERIDPDEARAKGVSCLLSKPFGLDEVVAALDRALAPSSTASGLGRKASKRRKDRRP